MLKLATARGCCATKPEAWRRGVVLVLECRQHAQQLGSETGGSQGWATAENGNNASATRAAIERLGRTRRF
jgi:hypothetical protein